MGHRRRLRQVAAAGLHLPSLPRRPRLHLHLRADPVLVAVEAARPDLEPVVRVAALVAEQKRRTAVLRHHQVQIAVAIQVGGRDTARVLDRDLRQAGLGGGVAKLPLAVVEVEQKCGAGGEQIEIAVVVRVEQHDTEERRAGRRRDRPLREGPRGRSRRAGGPRPSLP